jgi:hypothetical protein
VRLYHFHCASNRDAVFDTKGRWVHRVGDLPAEADKVARALMADGPKIDWSGWAVDVHDDKGRRALVRTFAEARRAAGEGGRRWR